MTMPWEDAKAAQQAPKVETMPWEDAKTAQTPAKPEDWQTRVQPIDLGNGKASVQREDGGVWFGREQGNKGKPGWFDAQGMRLGDAPGKQTAFMDKIINRDEARRSEINKKGVIPSLVSGIGDTGLALSNPGTMIRSAYSAVGQDEPAWNRFMPDPTVAGVVKGAVDSPLAIAQLGSHLMGSSAVDPLVNGVQGYYGQNFIPSKTGEALGQALPFLATGGSSAVAQAPKALTTAERVRAALAGIAKATGTGAVAAPALTPETGVQSEGDYWTRKLAEAKTGAKVGATLGTAGQVIGGVASKVKTPLSPEAQAIQDLGDQFGVRTMAPDLSASPGLNKAAVLAEQVPGSGMVSQRLAQQAEARAAAQKLLDQHGIQGDASTAIQQGLLNKLATAKGNAKSAYDLVGELAKGKGEVPLDETLKAIQKFKAQEASAVVPDQGLIGLLDKMESRLASPEVDKTFTGVRGLRSDLGSMISDYYKGTNAATGSKGVQVLQGVKGAVENDLSNFTSKNGPDLAAAAKRADSIYKNEVIPFKDRALASAVKSSEPDQIYRTFIQQGKGDRAQKFYNALDPDGQAAVRSQIVKDAFQAATVTDGVFSPAKFAQSLEKVKDASGVFFKGTDKFELDGFTNLMRHIQRAGQVAENPPTGQRLILTMLAGEGAGTIGRIAGHGPEAGVAALATGGTALLSARAMTKLFSSAAGKRLLLAASNTPVGSPSMERLMEKDLPRILAPSAPNVARLQTLPKAAGEGTPDLAKND